MPNQLSILRFVTMTDAHSSTGSSTTSDKERLPKRMYRGPPFLKLFPLFPNLPVEIRAMIWELALEPRVIDIKFTDSKGFFTRVNTPTILKVCKDSRNAVLHLYPTCFGNAMYKPRTIFNFSLDTLYFDGDFQNHLLHFFAGFNTLEISSLRYLAVDRYITTDRDSGEETEINYFRVMKRMMNAMPNMIEISVVFNLADWGDYPAREGRGPMKLFEEWPAKVKEEHDCWPDEFDFDDDDWETESELAVLIEEYCGEHDLPDPEEYIGKIEGLKVGSIWGWRPV